MPFKSKAQVAWMFANKPEMAKEFASKTKDFDKLPEKKRKAMADMAEKEKGSKNG